MRLDKELQQYRDIMKVPSRFEEGFSWTALVAALFIALLMVPGSMYMGLLIGQGGGASQWVTVILFLEAAASRGATRVGRFEQRGSAIPP